MQRGITLILHRPFMLRYPEAPATLSLTEFKGHVERASIHRGTSLTNVVGAGLLASRRRLPEQAGLGSICSTRRMRSRRPEAKAARESSSKSDPPGLCGNPLFGNAFLNSARFEGKLRGTGLSIGGRR